MTREKDIRQNDREKIQHRIHRINRRKSKGENIRNIETMQNIYDIGPENQNTFSEISQSELLFPQEKENNILPSYLTEFIMFQSKSPKIELEDMSSPCEGFKTVNPKTGSRAKSVFYKNKDVSKKHDSSLHNKQNISEKEGFSMDDVSNVFNGSGINLPVVENSSLYQFVFILPNLIEYIVSSFSLKFTQVLTELDYENQETEIQIANDSAIMKKIIYYIISFPLAVFVMYNWFFIIVYRDNDIFKRDKCQEQSIAFDVYNKPTCRPANDSQRMKYTFDGNSSKIILEFFLFFIVIPIKLFDKYIIGDKFFPQLICYIKWKILCKLIALIIAFIIVFWIGLFDTFTYIVSGNATIISAINSLIIFGYFIYYIICDVFGSEGPNLAVEENDTANTHNDNPLDSEKKIIDLGNNMLSNAINVTTSFTLVGICIKIIKYTLRFVVAILSIPISSVLLNMYIWFISFFGIIFYGGGVEHFTENFDKIEQFIESDLVRLFDKNTDCKEQGILMKILKSITKFIYKNFYSLTMLFLIAVNMMDTIVNMNSIIVKYVLIGLLGSPAIFLLLGVFTNNIDDLDE